MGKTSKKPNGTHSPYFFTRKNVIFEVMVRRLFILAAALLAMQTALPQMKRPEPPRAEFFTPDSARMRTSPSERTERLYDSIRSKTSRRAVPRMLYGLLFTRSRIDTTRSGAVEDESQRFLPYEGRTIGSVTIERNQVFDPDGNWLERTGNNLHILTRERVLRRDLLFGPGDTLDAEQLVRNQQLLRSRSYVSDAELEIRPDSLDSTRVDIIVHTRDSWTIGVDAASIPRGTPCSASTTPTSSVRATCSA